jgi:hypothetical protein
MTDKPDRVIFHCDCNSFYASCEETFRPELRNVPMSVAGDPEARHGIILASNQPAKKRGVKTAETIWQAKLKCPELVLVPPRHKVYGEFSERVNAIYEQYTPLVERFGVDESFLDLTGCLHQFSVDAATHAKVMDLFRKYLLAGGMPDAVNAFLADQNIVHVRRIQSEIHEYYGMDAAKYDTGNRLKIRRIYEMIPSETPTSSPTTAKSPATARSPTCRCIMRCSWRMAEAPPFTLPGGFGTFSREIAPMRAHQTTPAVTGQAFLYPCIPASLHSCIPASLHPCISASLHPCIPASLHPCISASLHPCISASLHPCIPAFPSGAVVADKGIEANYS